MNIEEKILQYFKKHDIGNDIKLVKNQEAKTNSDDASIESYSTEVNSGSGDKKSLLSKLKELESQLKYGQDDKTIQMIEYTPLTEDEIADKAKQGVEEIYGLKIGDLDDQKAKKLNAIEKDSEVLKQQANAQKRKLEELYSDAQEKVEQSAIKRGISRSSIVQEQIKDLSIEKIKDELSIDYSLASELKNNSDKISELESDYVKAINKLNVEKAVEISQKIDELTEKQNEKIEEVLKYNNTVKRQLASMKDEGYVPENNKENTKIRQNMLQEALNYYMSLPKEEAIKRFNEDNDVRQILGDLSTMLERYIKATN